MANSTMQAKAAKLRKQRRLFPKHLAASYVPVGRGPNKEVMSGYKERTRSLAFDKTYLDWLETVTRFHGKPPGKLEAEKAWERIRDAAPNLSCVTLVDNKVQNVKMFWNDARNQFILLEENYVGRFIRASIRYQDGERCKRRFLSGQVRWVEFVSSSPPEPKPLPALPVHWSKRLSKAGSTPSPG